MKKIALIYWPKKGNTEKSAYKIAEKLENTEVFTIKNITAAEFELFDAFIIGAPTTGADSWEDAHRTLWYDFFEKLGAADIKGKPFAVFGLGDQILYPYNFVDGIIDISREFEKNGAVHKGVWPAEGYDFKDSASLSDGNFAGLALDEDQESEKSDERIEKWISQISEEIGL